MSDSEQDASILGKRSRNGQHDLEDDAVAKGTSPSQPLEGDDDDDDVGPMPMPSEATGAKKKRKGMFKTVFSFCRASRNAEHHL